MLSWTTWICMYTCIRENRNRNRHRTKTGKEEESKNKSREQEEEEDQGGERVSSVRTRTECLWYRVHPAGPGKRGNHTSASYGRMCAVKKKRKGMERGKMVWKSARKKAERTRHYTLHTTHFYTRTLATASPMRCARDPSAIPCPFFSAECRAFSNLYMGV